MPAPTFVSEYESAWNSATTPKTVSVTTQTNDRLVVLGIVESSTQAMSTPTGGTGITWTLQKSFNSGNFTAAYIWTTTEGGAGQTFTLSVAKTGSLFWGFNVLHFRNTDGIGASAITNVTGAAPTLNLTTTQANSAICVVNGDWSAADGTSRTWRTNAGALTEDTYFRDSVRYAAYAGHHLDAGAAGTYAVGLTAPSQTYTIAAVEVKGTASAAAAIPSLVMARSI